MKVFGDADQDPLSGGGNGDGGVEVRASGSRDHDSSIVTGGQTQRVDVTVEELETDADRVEVRDRVPEEWEVDTGYGDAEDAGDDFVSFGTVDAEDAEGTYTYFAEAPDDVEDSDQYVFGPAEAVAETDDGDERDEFAGTEEVAVVGVST